MLNLNEHIYFKKQMTSLKNHSFALLLTACFSFVSGQKAESQKTVSHEALPFVSKSWISDNGDGTYKNPILHADYSDPDVIRVDSDYYMVTSSFNWTPGLPVLHSRDLVNWELIGHALEKLPPFDVYDRVQPGCGEWAPCIRYHNNEFYIFFPDPDYGIYMIKAKDPKGPWSDPVIVKEGKGMIDPTPLWDDDDSVYLAYAFAGSRAGIKSVLMVCTLSPDATKANNDDVVVFDGHEKDNTVEGPKFYKRNGWYYIFAPAGGVKPGWQLALRSENVFGPYESKVVMAQGKTAINGPHQGAWVTTVTGEDWFVHFQDKNAYGRVVHLNPLTWKNDWPVIGTDSDGDGCGEPVLTYTKPDVGKKYSIITPPENDEFNTSRTGLQWQWPANRQLTWGFPSGNYGYYRLNCIPQPEGSKSLWNVPNLMLQKFPAEEFNATVKLTFNPIFDNEEVGLVVMGMDYATLTLKRENGQLYLYVSECIAADQGGEPQKSVPLPIKTNTIWLNVKVRKGAVCQFSYSSDEKTFNQVGKPFTAKAGKWIGAKIGMYALRNGIINDAGYADIDWFRIEK